MRHGMTKRIAISCKALQPRDASCNDEKQLAKRQGVVIFNSGCRNQIRGLTLR